MRKLQIAILLTFVVTGAAFAKDERQTNKQQYMSMMATGQCWGQCAYSSSMEGCISCGLLHHSTKSAVMHYCHKLQPKCGRK
jgi:hypothetical protein